MVKRGRSKLTILTCKRCGHNWIPRISNPTVCPFCHSPYWDKPTSIKKGSLSLMRKPQREATEATGRYIKDHDSH